MNSPHRKLTPAQRLQMKLQQWRDLLDGDDHLAIWNQINAMLWWSAFYRSINEARKYLPEDKNGLKLTNGSIHQLIDKGYVTQHAVAIRRLVNDGRPDTNTLVNLIKDMKQNAALLTRQNMLEARDLVYDFVPIENQRSREAMEEAEKKGERAYFVSGEGWADSASWHDLCDDLCGTSSKNRMPSDQPSSTRFQQLADDLTKAARAVEEYVNNHIAHAAPPDRRAKLLPEYSSMRLATLWKAECVVVRVAGFITRCIVRGASASNVPEPQFDQFEYLDRSFVTPEAAPHMRDAWQQHDDQIAACRNWTWNQPVEG